MGLFRFIDTQPRVYVDRALEVNPGDEVEWVDGPPDDGQWEPATTSSKTKTKTKTKTAATEE